MIVAQVIAAAVAGAGFALAVICTFEDRVDHGRFVLNSRIIGLAALALILLVAALVA